MVTFEAKKGYACMCAGVLVAFKKGTFSTEDKKFAEELKKNKNVKLVKGSL